MNSDDKLRLLAQEWGIQLEYDGWCGHRQICEPPTLRALLSALGIEAHSDAAISDGLRAHQAAVSARHLPHEHVALAGASVEIAAPSACEWHVLDAEGNEVQAGRSDTEITPQALPVGYFTLVVKGADWSEEVFILSRPDAAPDIAALAGTQTGWGVSGALYALRSASNGGLGNYTDLASAMASLGQSGALFFGINPIHALGWAANDTISPYSPSHRGFLNIDHIATGGGLGPSPADTLVDYAGFRARHRVALEAEYGRFQRSAAPSSTSAFRSFCEREGAELAQFARFETTSEHHGSDFRDWPAHLRDPGGSKAGPRNTFHKWLQWQAETQIESAQRTAREGGMALGLYLDLAVGARQGGAEVWMHQDIVAHGVSIGAPPDHLSPGGQSWTLAAYAPNKLSNNRYEPIRSLLSKLMAKAGIIRIDHVLGLMRSFWVPDDGSPGGYVKQPFDSLLAVVAIEAWRNRCLVVGEDLGLVPPGFRERLNGSGLYSYAVWQYETEGDGGLRPARHMRPFSMTCFGTHDTPTIHGFWRGRDIEWWRKLGWLTAEQAEANHGNRAQQRNSLRQHCNVPPSATQGDIRKAIHTGLAQSPAALATVQLDDVFGCEDSQNLPGTINEHPNWRRRLPVAVEDFATSPAIAETSALMAPTRGTPAVDINREPDTCLT